MTPSSLASPPSPPPADHSSSLVTPPVSLETPTISGLPCFPGCPLSVSVPWVPSFHYTEELSSRARQRSNRGRESTERISRSSCTDSWTAKEARKRTGTSKDPTAIEKSPRHHGYPYGTVEATAGSPHASGSRRRGCHQPCQLRTVVQTDVAGAAHQGPASSLTCSLHHWLPVSNAGYRQPISQTHDPSLPSWTKASNFFGLYGGDRLCFPPSLLQWESKYTTIGKGFRGPEFTSEPEVKMSSSLSIAYLSPGLLAPTSQ